MIIPILATAAFLFWTGRRGAIANQNIVVGITAFRVHKITLTNIECAIKLSFLNSSNQAYTLNKAFFVVKYPKGNLSNSFSNELASFESLQLLQIPARGRVEADAKVNIPTTKLLSVIKQYLTTSEKMLGEVTGTISFANNSNGINLPAFEFDLRQSLNSVRDSIKGVLAFLKL